MSVKIRFRVASLSDVQATLTATPDHTIEDSQRSTKGETVGALVVHFDTGEAKNLMKLGNEVIVELSQAPKLKPPKD